MGRIEHMLLDEGRASSPTDLRPSPATPPYHKKLQLFLSATKGRDTPMDAPARSNTLSPRRYPGQATRIHLEGGAYLAGRRGPCLGLACLGVLERLRRDARGLRQLPAGQPALLSQAPHLLAVHDQIHHSFLLVCSLWQPPQTNVCSCVSLALVAPSLVVAAWVIGPGLSAIRAAAARQRLDPLDLFARLLIDGAVAEVDVPVQAGVRVILVVGRCVEGIAGWRYPLGVHSSSLGMWAGAGEGGRPRPAQ